MHHFLKALSERVLLCDGAMGTLLQSFHLDIEKDFLGKENCFEILNLTRPDIVQKAHEAYLKVGVDCIETNTFGANKAVLSEFGLSDKAYEINVQAAMLARNIADKYSDLYPRFVIGSMGPGSKLPSFGHVDYDTLKNSYAEQARGLIDGGVDLLLLETNQDLLTIKAAIAGCKIAKLEKENHTPIFAHVTMEATGTMLVGSNIESVVSTLSAMDIDGLGMNCGLGPVEMAQYVEYLGKHWSKYISIMPNAGLPMVVNGETKYSLTPNELAAWHQRFIEEDGVNLVGGCCGTTPTHIAAVRKMLDDRSDKKPIKKGIKESFGGLTSLFVDAKIKSSDVFKIGERANANGSKKFRELLADENWNEMLAIAKAQIKESADAVDICMAYTGRDEVKDMTHFLSLCRTQIKVPLVIDSTNKEVIRESLKLLGGKSLINSINLEDGKDHAVDVLMLAKQFGCAVIALTIDEKGMAKSVEDKLHLTDRLYDLAVRQQGLPEEDLFIDPLTFSIATGLSEDRSHGIDTLNAIELIKSQYPKCQIILGLSNISYGLKPNARHVLNSVFLYHAKKRGVSAVIIDVSKIRSYEDIPFIERQAAEALIFNQDSNALGTFIKLFEEAKTPIFSDKKIETIEDKLKTHILEAEKYLLEKDLDEALKKYSPITIINEHLLMAMEEVGEAFGAGKTQLPFVLQSAETMRAAVEYLKPFMSNEKVSAKGTILLATVRGDVHDIGKNLVDIVLSNNGYYVINIGIKQSIDMIIDAVKKYQPDVLGLSGLLVKSTLIMKDDLARLKEEGFSLPVILGGAALTRQFVEKECRSVYGEKVFYAKDAFDGLDVMKNCLCEVG